MLNSFSHSDNPFPHAVHLVIKQPRKQQALWCHPVIPSSGSSSVLWEAQMCCSTTIETSPNLTPFLARRFKWARKAGQTEATKTVAWQYSYKKKTLLNSQQAFRFHCSICEQEPWGSARSRPSPYGLQRGEQHSALPCPHTRRAQLRGYKCCAPTSGFLLALCHFFFMYPSRGTDTHLVSSLGTLMKKGKGVFLLTGSPRIGCVRESACFCLTISVRSRLYHWHQVQTQLEEWGWPRARGNGTGLQARAAGVSSCCLHRFASLVASFFSVSPSLPVTER